MKTHTIRQALHHHHWLGDSQFQVNYKSLTFYLLEDINTLDRAKFHLPARRKAEVRGKTLAKLCISIKLMFLEKEDLKFKTEWATAILEAERSLSETLQKGPGMAMLLPEMLTNRMG